MYNNYFKHVGVLGMKWGHKKSSSSGETKVKKSIFKNPEKLKKAAKITAFTLLAIGNLTLSVYMGKRAGNTYRMNKQ